MAKRRADGLICKTMTDPRTGKRVYFYGKTEREVNRKIMEYQTKVTDGRTFKEVADEWWDITEPTLSPNSVHGYRVAHRRALEWLGKLSIKSITAWDVYVYINRIVEMRFAYKTVANHLMVVREVFAHGIIHRDVRSNPAREVSVPKGLPEEKRSAATPEEEEIIKKSADVWLLPFFVLYTGLRLGEALGITGADIDMERRIIHVRRSVYWDGSKPRTKEPKTEAGTRSVPILKPLMEKLPSIESDAYLFPSARDPKTPMGRYLYNDRYNKYREQTGIASTLHQIRHSYATILYECGIDAKTAQHLLGHAQISTTLDIYTDFRKEHVPDLAQIIDDKMIK